MSARVVLVHARAEVQQPNGGVRSRKNFCLIPRSGREREDRPVVGDAWARSADQSHALDPS